MRSRSPNTAPSKRLRFGGLAASASAGRLGPQKGGGSANGSGGADADMAESEPAPSASRSGTDSGVPMHGGEVGIGAVLPTSLTCHQIDPVGGTQSDHQNAHGCGFVTAICVVDSPPQEPMYCPKAVG